MTNVDLDLDDSLKRHAWRALPEHVRVGLIIRRDGGAEKYTLAELCRELGRVSGQLEEMNQDMTIRRN